MLAAQPELVAGERVDLTECQFQCELGPDDLVAGPEGEFQPGIGALARSQRELAVERVAAHFAEPAQAAL
ncbi:MAG: hypothetical protein CVU24_17585 [Betaproteobacteria bacterium HGW-Betaproteobacteria-18]|nr:MAG: hypothetical protein CVU24_17585 [Betaproteobacteria bacterium HGW-Betaproteobacteria-18]